MTFFEICEQVPFGGVFHNPNVQSPKGTESKRYRVQKVQSPKGTEYNSTPCTKKVQSHHLMSLVPKVWGIAHTSGIQGYWYIIM